MGAEHSKVDSSSAPNTTGNSLSSMTTTEDDTSEYSVEMGAEWFQRIEYPQEVYDRVCGRLKVKHPPLAKKQKVEDWLSDSQSSQATPTSKDEVPSRSRKRKNKQADVPSAKKSVPTNKKTGNTRVRKTLELRGTKKEVKIEYETEEESSDSSATDEDDDSSESDSSPERAKKKGSSALKAQRDRSRSINAKDKIRTKIEESKEEKKRSVHNETRGEKSHSTRDEKKKERKNENVMRADKVPKIEVDEEEESSIREVKKERKEMNVIRMEMEKKEKKNGDESGKGLKNRSMGGKETSDASKQVPSNPKQPENRSDGTTSATSLSSSVPPPRKAVVKKIPSSKTKSSDDSVLPPCMQQLFSGASASSSVSSLAAFKVPKKKELGDGRVIKKTGGGPSVVMDKSDETKEGRKGWDPRTEAFVPPPRKFVKPPVKISMGMERKKSIGIERQPEGKPPLSIRPLVPSPISNPYEEKTPFGEDNETWEKILMDVSINPLTPSSPSASSYLTDADLSSLAQWGKKDSLTTPIYNRPTKPTMTSHASYTMETDSSKSTIGTPFDESHKHAFPTPKWTEGRETETLKMERRGGDERRREEKEVHSSSEWMSFDSMESSIESTNTSNTRWDEYSTPSGRRSQDNCRSPTAVNTPISPPHSASSSISRRPSIDTPPTMIPIDGTTVRYKFIPIDDDCLPPWNRNDRYKSTSAIYSVSSPVLRYEAMIVAGPVPDHVDKKKLEKIMKSKGSEVEWAEAPASKDTLAMLERTVAVILCPSERTAKSLLAEGDLKVDRSYLPLGRPGEVLLSVEGLEENFDQNELFEEITDTIETYMGGMLVELLIFPPKSLILEGKARFFYAVHGSRAAFGAPIPLGGGRFISFSVCPPEKSTIWIAEIHSPVPSDARVAARASSLSRASSSTPVLPDPSIPQPVPPPSVVSLSPSVGPIKTDPSSTVSLSNASLPSLMSLNPQVDNGELSRRGFLPIPKEENSSSSSSSILHSSSKFSCLPPPTAIPPPGLVDPTTLRLMMKVEEQNRLYDQTISIPAISVPAGVIPLPPARIPPPINMIPVLPYPDLPPIQHVFFQVPPPEKKNRSQKRKELMKVDPATFIKPFKMLLPKGMDDNQEILLFARPMASEGPQQTDWDAVREYFKDDDCSSRVYGGVVSLRFHGGKAKEKAQVLMLNGPHSVNEQMFAIGITHYVMMEASKAVAKARLYEEVMERYGSVVEVEKKCDTSSGKPVYKIYFDKLETAQSAATEGITIGDITLSNIGTIPQ